MNKDYLSSNINMDSNLFVVNTGSLEDSYNATWGITGSTKPNYPDFYLYNINSTFHVYGGG